jgi:hypothetical protein
MKKCTTVSKIFIQTTYCRVCRRRRGRAFPMKLSPEFVEKFSEIFLEDTMADIFTPDKNSR